CRERQHGRGDGGQPRRDGRQHGQHGRLAAAHDRRFDSLSQHRTTMHPDALQFRLRGVVHSNHAVTGNSWTTAGRPPTETCSPFSTSRRNLTLAIHLPSISSSRAMVPTSFSAALVTTGSSGGSPPPTSARIVRLG